MPHFGYHRKCLTEHVEVEVADPRLGRLDGAATTKAPGRIEEIAAKAEVIAGAGRVVSVRVLVDLANKVKKAAVVAVVRSALTKIAIIGETAAAGAAEEAEVAVVIVVHGRPITQAYENVVVDRAHVRVKTTSCRMTSVTNGVDGIGVMMAQEDRKGIAW